MQVEINDNVYDVEIIKKNNKNTYIRVKDGKIIVTTNRFVSTASIMKLINSNFPENKNFLLFNDLYNIYKLNIKSIHDNLQENANKITTVEEIPICFMSDLYTDKIFTISSDDEFVKNDINESICLIGGNTLMKNFPEKLKMELKKLLKFLIQINKENFLLI